MKLKKLKYNLSVCKVKNIDTIDVNDDFFFIGKKDEEISLVCRTESVPSHTTHREDGWKGFRIEGELDFSLIGIISKISTILANHKIGIFVISTYNTDYVLVKKENFEQALHVLELEGYTIL